MDTYSLAERPDLVDQFWGVGGDWPTFMLKNPVARTRYELATELFPGLHLLALEDDQVIARVHAVPIPWPGADELPDRGWDWALEPAVDNPTGDRSAVSLIEARNRPALTRPRAQRPPSSPRPVTPSTNWAPPTSSDPSDQPEKRWSHAHPRTSTAPGHATGARPTGGRIVKVAPLSMTIPGTLTQWREWTGLHPLRRRTHRHGGPLAQDSASGSVAYPARRWLVAAGWSTARDLVCPEH